MGKVFKVAGCLLEEATSLRQEVEYWFEVAVEKAQEGANSVADTVLLRALELEATAHGKMSAADLMLLGGRAEADRWLDLAIEADSRGSRVTAEYLFSKAVKLS